MGIVARFAPSPTGQVHIGNIRTAIFNWLFARHEKGTFLLRIEDTDLERSTKQAIDTLIECMDWLGMDHDGGIMYQTKQAPKHLAAAKKLLEEGNAYKLDPSSETSPVLFRIPYFCDGYSFVKTRGTVETKLEQGSEVTVSRSGLVFHTLGAKGQSVENTACLAGFKDLKIFSPADELLYELTDDEAKTRLASPDAVRMANAGKLVFTRREVFYDDMVKGRLAKPLDSMKDFVVIRSDGSPVFHLANVWDDIDQGVTHIVRGDDHVENTYRHLFIFKTLGYEPPIYAHMPMIVNAQGKPYSKRDGDAFVGDFREKGILPEALFNSLSLLGWSPGDNREKMTRQELIDAFDIHRVQHAPAQFNTAKLANMNGTYIAEMAQDKFLDMAWDFASRYPWRPVAKEGVFTETAKLMQTRTKLFTDVAQWQSFFTSDFVPEEKAVRKNLSDENVNKVLLIFADKLEALGDEATPAAVEEAMRATEKENSLKDFALNQPLRAAVTGLSVGAGMYETACIIGLGECARRIRKALAK